MDGGAEEESTGKDDWNGRGHLKSDVKFYGGNSLKSESAISEV